MLDSSFVHETVSPTEIVIAFGPKAKFSIETSAPEPPPTEVELPEDPPEHAARSNAPAMRPDNSKLLLNMGPPDRRAFPWVNGIGNITFLERFYSVDHNLHVQRKDHSCR